MEFLIFEIPRLKGRFKADLWPQLNHLPEHSGVYLLTETNLGVKYVGSSINVRSRAIGYMYPNSPDYRKTFFYNLDTHFIKIELLQDCKEMTVDELRMCEVGWIKKLNTFYPNGLNKNTAVKGTGKVDRQIFLAEFKKINKVPKCAQILHFSKRLNFYLDALEATPPNRLAYDNHWVASEVSQQRYEQDLAEFNKRIVNQDIFFSSEVNCLSA